MTGQGISILDSLAGKSSDTKDQKLDSQTRMIVWTILDTSIPTEGEFGIEMINFSNYQLVADFTQLRNSQDAPSQTVLNCALVATSNDQTEKVEIPYKVKVQNQPIILGFNNQTNETSNSSLSSRLVFDNYGEDSIPISQKNSTLKLDFFHPYKSIQNYESEFKGEALTYTIGIDDEDILNNTIQIQTRFQNYVNLSKILRCSRSETVVKDTYISKTGSIYILTSQNIFKIKNGTTYSVQNYMQIGSQSGANGGSETVNCHKILLNEAKNVIISLCDKSKIPYIILSNWNSMKPSNAFEKQVSFHDIDLIQYSFIEDFNIFLFGKPQKQGIQTKTQVIRYELVLSGSLNIQFKERYRFDLHQIISKIDHIIFTEKVNGKKEKSSYFVALSGDLSNSISAILTIYKDEQVNGSYSLTELKSMTFSKLLGMGSLAIEKFSGISNLKCISETAAENNFEFPSDLANKSNEDYLYFSCVVTQNRNYHFELNFKIEQEDPTNILYKSDKGYIGYGDFITRDALDIHKDYFAVLITRTRWRPPKSQENDEAFSSLPNSYMIVYERPVSFHCLLKLSVHF